MFTSQDADRVSDGINAAAVGYADATTAAFAEMMNFGIGLWTAALSGFAATDGDPPVAPLYTPKLEPAFGHSPDDWCGLPWLDPARVDAWSRLWFEATPAGAFAAYAGLVPLRGSYAAWPVAKTMIDAGVPRSVAWPAAEANAAALEATDAAVVAPLRRVFATAHSTGGYAIAAWPPLPALTLLLWALPTIGNLYDLKMPFAA